MHAAFTAMLIEAVVFMSELRVESGLIVEVEEKGDGECDVSLKMENEWSDGMPEKSG